MDLDLVDVEWVDGDDGGIRRSTLDSVAGVAFEVAAPVRSFSSYRGRRHATGWYWAATTGSLVGFESWLERDRAMLLDHEPQVVGLSSQPFRLTWPGSRPISHTPDYFARLEDGSALVVDVRPFDRVRPEDAAKFSATEAMCRELGCWSFVLVHEPDPVEMANVRWLADIGIRVIALTRSGRGCWASSTNRACWCPGSRKWGIPSRFCPCCSICCGAVTWIST